MREWNTLASQMDENVDMARKMQDQILAKKNIPTREKQCLLSTGLMTILKVNKQPQHEQKGKEEEEEEEKEGGGGGEGERGGGGKKHYNLNFK